MKMTSHNRLCPARRQQAGSRILLLVVVCFLLGAGVSAYWFHRRGGGTAESTQNPATSSLSDSTRAVLRQLNAPIDMHYYALLDPATVPDSVKTFADRVDQLLTRYQQASDGRITVTRFKEQSNANANSALADGLKPFNQDKGNACFLGIAVVHEGKKESLALLSSEWEPALEADLSRAIVRLNDATTVLKPTTAPPPIDAATAEDVKRAIPNFDSVSVEEGTKVLRQAALDQFAQTSQEMDAKMKEAQQKFLDAEKSQNTAEQLAARQLIQQLQAEQAEKLKQIVARSQAQIEVLQRLKAPTGGNPQ